MHQEVGKSRETFSRIGLLIYLANYSFQTFNSIAEVPLADTYIQESRWILNPIQSKVALRLPLPGLEFERYLGRRTRNKTPRE